jgi:hypothetical protein
MTLSEQFDQLLKKDDVERIVWGVAVAISLSSATDPESEDAIVRAHRVADLTVGEMGKRVRPSYGDSQVGVQIMCVGPNGGPK